jgi:hypothetical protein
VNTVSVKSAGKSAALLLKYLTSQTKIVPYEVLPSVVNCVLLLLAQVDTAIPTVHILQCHLLLPCSARNYMLTKKKTGCDQ